MEGRGCSRVGWSQLLCRTETGTSIPALTHHHFVGTSLQQGQGLLVLVCDSLCFTHLQKY